MANNNENSIIAFTWSPNPAIFFRQYKPKKQHDSCVPYLKKLWYCSEFFHIYPELSRKGRIHYHMIIDVKDRVRWDKVVHPYFQMYGTTYVDKNVNDGWIHYCTKDVDHMTKVLAPYLIPFTQKTIKKGKEIKHTVNTILDYMHDED